MPAPEEATCRDCGQPILWLTLISGGKMPVDPVEELRAAHIGNGRWVYATCHRHHSAICPARRDLGGQTPAETHPTTESEKEPLPA